MNRTEIADLIAPKLETAAAELTRQYHQPGLVPAFRLDDLLPEDLARDIHSRFPPSERMVLRKSIRENKHIGAQMDRFDPLLEETVYAFQDERVVDLIARITRIKGLEPDPELYAGGISAMSKGAYLRPHLDNSHDARRERYRVLNLLFYVTPGWRNEYGGAFQLWDNGPKGEPRTIGSDFNSLVVMATNRRSWHSVSEVLHDGRRCCVSNYYFSRQPAEDDDYFHATSFRGEPHQKVADFVMRADNALRTTILKVLDGKVYRNPHIYKKDDQVRP